MAESWFEATAREVTRARLEYYGFTPEQIAFTDQERPHGRYDLTGNRCELTEHGWECWDENGDPAHPLHDEATEAAEFVVFVMEWLADRGLLVEPGSETREECDVDRLPGDWHKLHDDHYESAVAESAGALAGHMMAKGEDLFWTETFLAAFRGAVATAFNWGYTAGKEDSDA